MRHTDIGLKLDGVIKTTLDQVYASKRVLDNRDATALNKALWSADTLIIRAKLREQTHVN
jgi:hypothetical protein